MEAIAGADTWAFQRPSCRRLTHLFSQLAQEAAAARQTCRRVFEVDGVTYRLPELADHLLPRCPYGSLPLDRLETPATEPGRQAGTAT